MERKQHETLMVYFKGRCNGSGPNSSTLPGLLPCLPSWRFIFPYKSPCCWHAPVCLLHCSYYADSLEGWALPKGLCPAAPCLPDWGALCSLMIAWGLRSTLTQSFQEGVTEPWISGFPWIWREKGGQLELELEGKRGSWEGREIKREH